MTHNDAIECKVTYETPTQDGPIRHGKHYRINAATRKEFDQQIQDVLKLPGYKTWRTKPTITSFTDFEDGFRCRKTEYRARVIVWDGPEDEPVPGEKAEWPILKY